MRYDVTLVIGHNVDGQQAHTTRNVVDAAVDVLNMDGATVCTCTGIWRGETEDVTVIKLNAVTASEYALMQNVTIPALAAVLMQDCIMCEREPSRTTFIEPAETRQVKTA